MLNVRSGVEDTRLEAKAKDTKKNPRPRTALPRTYPLEAKNKNTRGQGSRTQAQEFSKKKDLQKNYLGVRRNKTSSKNFFKRSAKFLQFKK